MGSINYYCRRRSICYYSSILQQQRQQHNVSIKNSLTATTSAGILKMYVPLSSSSSVYRSWYSNTALSFHYKYPNGPGHYGSPPSSDDTIPHHHHDHHTHDHHHHGEGHDHGHHHTDHHHHDHSHTSTNKTTPHQHHHDHHHHHPNEQPILHSYPPPPPLMSSSSSSPSSAASTTTTSTTTTAGIDTINAPIEEWNNVSCNVSSIASLQYQYQYNRPLRTDYTRRGYTVGIGGPVGSGKTATVLKLCHILPLLAKQMIHEQYEYTTSNNNTDTNNTNTNTTLELGVVTNDIFTQEDSEYLIRQNALQEKSYQRIIPVETGGCPHTAIREDISSNISALEKVTRTIQNEYKTMNNNNNNNNNTKHEEPNILLLCESGGDNLAANFSYELVDLTIYVIDVAGGDKIPRKGGPGITQSDLLIINKIDIAHAVQSNLYIMYRDANIMRTPKQQPTIQIQQSQQESSNDNNNNNNNNNILQSLYTKPIQPGPILFCSMKHNIGIEQLGRFILSHYLYATRRTGTRHT